MLRCNYSVSVGRAGNKEYPQKIIAGIRNDAKGLGWVGMDNYKSCKM
jgi:hypothetical protein